MLPLDPTAAKLASSLTFADSDGGPLIVMSESLAPSWNGGSEATSPSDYERACRVAFTTIDVGDREALVLEEPNNSAFIPIDDGAMIVAWIGADDAETLLTGALALTDADFSDELSSLEHDGGKLVMFDAAWSGREIDPRRVASIELPAGTYAATLCLESEATVAGKEGAPHAVIVQALRLRRST